MQDAKEEIRARLPIEDVVSQYIELKRAGRTLKGRSPWGVDKTPSFMVSPEKGIWHDFSANKGGDIFSFIMEVEGITFREALEKLAAQAGVELKKYDKSDEKNARLKMRAKEVNELACKYYQVCLAKNKAVCEYVFYGRKLNRNTIVEFRIGYAPNTKNSLVEFLKKRGYSVDEAKEAGLINRFNGDLFKGRMMIPFLDANTGEVIGFTGRIIEKGEPKYLNTPETRLFNKGRFIFGLSQAKEAIRKNNFVVIVEGNMDVISSHQAGVKEAVATSGTAMTENHLKILSRLTTDIRLAYDGDEAGIKAAERAIMLAGKIGISLSVISGYGKAKDPDELIKIDPKLWQECVEERMPAVDWILKKYENKLNLMTGPGKKEYSDMAMKIISYIEDPVEKKHYEQLVARKLDVTVEDLQAKKITTETIRLKPVVTRDQGKTELAESMMVMKNLEDSLQAILVYGGVVGQEIALEVPEDETRLEELSLIFEEKYAKMKEEALAREVVSLNSRYKEELKKRRIVELTEELVKFENDEEKTIEILKQIEQLRRE
ncbi:MAG: DNA primase [Candidatus Nanosyncoccus sp.]